MENDEQWTLHDWSDEDCMKILKQCKHAITSKGQQKVGKVIIIDIVRGSQNGEESNETQLLWDLEMMVTVTGLERNEMEWAKLFFDAGFIRYKIHNQPFVLPTARDLIPKGCSGGETLKDEGVSMATNSTQDDSSTRQGNSNKNGRYAYILVSNQIR
ncbi:hypothetical protein POTOM_044555 [Populus tomentosa]|uniref:O-methyltransferase C-terminal domain-containing protein n=1 Tax=Populus tomentosa TaxID=118781 RepID=A0A8X8C829_POPTO|nr:hypothetical protein POTOM_044555 [Populus tomentosa]